MKHKGISFVRVSIASKVLGLNLASHTVQHGTSIPYLRREDDPGQWMPLVGAEWSGIWRGQERSAEGVGQDEICNRVS